MSKRRRYKPEEKLAAVLEYVNGNKSYTEAGKVVGVDSWTVRDWVFRYKLEGAEAFFSKRKNKQYPEELRKAAVMDYQAGTGSLREICSKYKIREKTQLRMWIEMYNGHIEIRTTGGCCMTKEAKEENGYPVETSCELFGVSRAAYYRWLSGKKCARELENEKIAQIMEQIHTESPDKGYRRIKDDLSHDHELNVNEKRVLRICRSLDIKSTIKYKNNGCTRQAANPQHIAKNWLNRQFHASMPNEKWLTAVTEFKYYIGSEKHKVYLSAILDLYDRRIVSFVIRDRNDNALVFDTLDAAIAANPDAHPLFHSDRGFQYTNRTFYNKLKAAKMKQSMSRVAKCIDNGPMEGFWGILKRERYYGKRFTSRDDLVSMIENYITYYNNRRVQRNLGVLTPIEKHESYLMAA